MFYSSSDILKEISTSTAKMRLLTSGIVHYSYLANVTIDVEQQLENHYALIDLVGTEKHLLLLDASELIDLTPKAAEKVKELEPNTPILARAFVTESLGHRLLISFYLKVKRSGVQNKVFSNYEDAVVWLQKLKLNVVAN